jgi:hypothetical protein
VTIFSVVIVLAVVGALLWLVNRYIPMAPPFKTIINVIVILAVVLWLLSVFGVLGQLEGARVPRLHR